MLLPLRACADAAAGRASSAIVAATVLVWMLFMEVIQIWAVRRSAAPPGNRFVCPPAMGGKNARSPEAGSAERRRDIESSAAMDAASGPALHSYRSG
jgi:hypothetical protein